MRAERSRPLPRDLARRVAGVVSALLLVALQFATPLLAADPERTSAVPEARDHAPHRHHSHAHTSHGSRGSGDESPRHHGHHGHGACCEFCPGCCPSPSALIGPCATLPAARERFATAARHAPATSLRARPAPAHRQPPSIAPPALRT